MLLYGDGTGSVRNTDGTFSSYSMPGGTLSDDGDMVLIDFGYNVSPGGTGTLSVSFGATSITLGGAFSNGDDGHFQVRVIRTGAATQAVASTMLGTIGTGTLMEVKQTTAAETLSGAITISASLSGAGGGIQVTGRPFTVTLFQV